MPDTAVRSGGLLRERMIIRRTAEMLVSALPPDVLFPRVCDLLASQFGAHFVAIVESDSGTMHVKWSFSAGDEEPSAAIEAIDVGDLDAQASTIRSIPGERVVLFIPLRYGPGCFGFLTLAGGAKRFTPEHVSLLETCARYMAVAIFNVTLSQEKERLEALATRDALTGAYNRRAFDERLLDEWRRAVRSREPLSLVMLDVDYFKVYNDSYGHVAGDHCLQQVVQALLSCVSRSGDMVARYGGEEFVALLPNTPEQGGVDVAERMCKKVAELRIVHRGSELDHVSISAGVATMFASNEDIPQTLITTSDTALYRAKEGGRNRAATATYLGEAPAARRRFEGRSNLPAQSTSFIGRESELAMISRALPTSAVLSILGPGGVGKTRLAIAAAQAALPTFPGGAWLIEVGAETDENRLPALVARAIGLPAADPIEELLVSLATSPALIILDSCEHLLGACKSLVGNVTRRCHDARIVTTSRQPLEIAGEVGIRLEPFPLADATKLFVARARDVRPQFAPGPSEDSVVREVVGRVDCLPLGIELAAMRLRNMSLQQLAEHGSPLAHPTDLHDRIAWSFDMLGESERRFLARLSIFRGPFDEDAARAVAGGETFDGPASFEILTQLVEKSLVQVDLESGRYRLLATIADYMRVRLTEFDDPNTVRTAAMRHYAGVVGALRAELQSGAPPEIFERYAAVRENVEAVLESALAGEDVESGAALAAGMADYWIETGRYAEASRFLNIAIAKADRLSRRRLLDVLESAIEVEAAGTDGERLESLGERFRAETGTSNDGAETARVMLALALAHHARARFDEAGSLYHHASNAFRIAGESRSLARALLGWSEIVAERQGDIPRAIALLTEALDAGRVCGSASIILEVVAELVEVNLLRNDEAHAVEVIQDIAAQCHEFADEAGAAFTTLLLARVELRSDSIVGRMHARDALETLRAYAHPGRLAACFELFARMAVEGQQDETAARLLAFAAGLRRTHGVAGSQRERREIARLNEILERRMDRAARERAAREGRAMALEGAVHRAFTEGKPASMESTEALILA